MIEDLTNENLELKSRIMELNSILSITEINHKIELNKLKMQYELSKDKIYRRYDEAQFKEKIFPLTQKCYNSMSLIFNMLKETYHANKEIERELYIYENLREEAEFATNVSLVQEEGKVLSLGLTQKQVIDEPLARYDSPDEISNSKDDLQEIIKRKDREIMKHKKFIKTLKVALEEILKSKT
ncbi:hypothetical protein SteCoe_20397 [Stentor coeruleus]|uniref:Uncharacterized protein n=1 Tax=Stentor coeruleus TaxID=5963 RepID=A0A1R2BSB2_9CILI|nr:hypothetical protein SteCoe_20397 [Stentor coeruleus]